MILTPEREKEIREITIHTEMSKFPPLQIRDELLAEIDALRKLLNTTCKIIIDKGPDPDPICMAYDLEVLKKAKLLLTGKKIT